MAIGSMHALLNSETDLAKTEEVIRYQTWLIVLNLYIH